MTKEKPFVVKNIFLYSQYKGNVITVVSHSQAHIDTTEIHLFSLGLLYPPFKNGISLC